MKVKDIERTANVAWSPKNHYPIYLAAGTAASQLDASFNTSAALEIYSLNITEPGPDTQLISSVSSEHRFHKIIWGPAGDDSEGTVIAGCEDGLLQIYSASKLLKNQQAVIGKEQKHSGPVHALDFNNFQQNLFASGAGESEIFIWDLNNTKTPMSPGVKSQPLEDVLSVAWNKQVQHILASSFASKCVIWDLRKNEPIIKLTDAISRIRWKMVSWHPEVATQLCLASEEDHCPVIQLWDLRFATSPLKTFENHQRGVLAISWCDQDSDLLISCGKDDRILCWNPNCNQPNGEVLSEVAKTTQWSFDVVWSPRNPALIACPNYDGHVYVYSIMGGKTQQIQTTNKIADSFPGMDGFVHAPAQQQSHITVSVDPTKPPKWLRKPVGARFGFGGKLISFENDKAAVIAQGQQTAGQISIPVRRSVQISQVITETEFVQKSADLELALESGNFVEYCLNKSNESNDQHKKFVWHFLKANFELNPRAELLNLLGYRIEDVNNKLNQHIGKRALQAQINDLGDQLAGNRIEDYDREDPFEAIAQQNGNNKPSAVVPFLINTNDDSEGLITQALLLNNTEAAVELCLKAEKYADALIIATTGGPELLARTQHKYLEQSEGYVSNLISALVSEDWSSIINNCNIISWKEALAATLTHASEEDLPLLCEQLGARLEAESHVNPEFVQDAQLCYICSGSFGKLVSSWTGNEVVTSTKDLQELVELVSFLQKAIERQGKHVEINGALADLLSRYASLLAAQGNLQTALSYLGSSQNDKVASLRDRLLTSLGQKPLNVQEMRQQQKSGRNSTRTSLSAYPGGAINNTTSNSFHQISPFNSMPAPSVTSTQSQNLFGNNNFNTGLSNAPSASAHSWQTPGMQNSSIASPPTAANAQQWSSNPHQPPKAFSPGPPPPITQQPPRPDSVGSTTSAGRVGTGPLTRNKYLRDPSVSNNQYPGMNNQQYTPNMPLNPGMSSTFDNNYNPLSAPPNNVPSYGQNATAPPQMYQPSLPIGQQFVEQAQPAASLNHQTEASTGWNDPPMFNRPPRHVQKSDIASVEPITHPIYGTAPTQQANGYNNYGDINNGSPSSQATQNYGASPLLQPSNTFNPCLPNNNHPSGPYSNSNNFTPSPANFTAVAPPQLSQSSGTYDPMNFNQNAIGGLATSPQPAVYAANKPEIPQSIQKQPIPSEHEVLQKVFDELKDRCNLATNNPQTKRKVDDVGRRLETLYDSLRFNKLSANALTGLHQIVHFIQTGEYTNCLQLLNQLVQGPDFAQISSFMPGIKVLIQLALQLHVYLS